MARDLNDTLLFVKVVEQGSFTAAAKLLGLPKTTVSRKVLELETRLGAQLLNRTTRKLGLTEAGSVYYEHGRRIVGDLEDAETAVQQLQSGPRGWLRFTAPMSLGLNSLGPLLVEFRQRHPDVRLDMVLSNERLDLIGNGLDLALRFGALPDSTLVARRLATLQAKVFAGLRYLERFGEPLAPEDLEHHRTLAMPSARRGARWVWPLTDGRRTEEFAIQPVLVANDPFALKPALFSGEGLVMTSDVVVGAELASGCVRRVLAGWRGPESDLNAVFPRGQALSPKVRVFVDFLIERLSLEAPAPTESSFECCIAEAEALA